MGLHELDQKSDKGRAGGSWWLPASALVAALLLMLAGETGSEWLRFERYAIASGQIWRLVSGHFVHLGWPHFALNGAGLALVWYLVGNVYGKSQWLLISAVSIFSIDLGLWFLNPKLMWYVGLSGLLHGILIAGLVEKLRKPDFESLALTVLLLGKLAYEQINGPLPGSEATTGGTVVIDSHLFGALGGILAAIALRIRVRRGAPI
jgi:rhomboid family GlyGly-CTERM serine protease